SVGSVRLAGNFLQSDFTLGSDGAGGSTVGLGRAKVYMTGTADPWSVAPSDPGSPDAAMNTAFGPGNWTKIQGFTSSVLSNPGYKFIYLDGGDGDSAEFDQFISANITGLQNFVRNGGELFINAARWITSAGSIPVSEQTFAVGFGATLH